MWEIFVVAMVAGKLRQLDFKETTFIYIYIIFQSTLLNKKPRIKTYKLQKVNAG